MSQLRSSLFSYNNSRNDAGLPIPKVKVEFSKTGFQYAGIRAWNDMPIYIRELSSISLFKSHLKRHLMSNEN